MSKLTSEQHQQDIERKETGTKTVEIPALFEDLSTSEHYVKQRHSYSEELFQSITDYCRETTQDLNLAVDVGCGPGNSTVGFTKYFKQVIGVDISESQIALAPKDIPNCEFKVGDATDLDFLEAASVDLFACGLAFNLMPKAKVLAEANRVLRPGGTLAIFGYGRAYCTQQEIDAVVEPMYSTAVQHSKELKEVIELYPDVQLPYPGWIRKNDVIFRQTMKQDGIIEFARLLNRFMLSNGHDEPHFVQTIESQLSSVYAKRGWNCQTQEFEMKFQGTILLAHKPV